MNREARLKYLKIFVENLNRDVADLPYNIGRFSIEGIPYPRGYDTVFYFTDNLTEEFVMYHTRWFPMKTKGGGYIAPMDVLEKFNDFIIERRAYK